MSSYNDNDFEQGLWTGAGLCVLVEALVVFIICMCAPATFDGTTTRTMTLKYQCDNDIDKLELIPQMVNVVTNANMVVTSIRDENEDSKNIVVVRGEYNEPNKK